MAPLNGYPDSFGAHRSAVLPHTGPASYTQVSVGPLAGGDSVSASEAGITFLDFVTGGLSDSGDFRVDAVPNVGNPSDGGNGAAGQSYTLKWTALRTATIGGQGQTINTQAATATNLSAEVVRLSVLGRY